MVIEDVVEGKETTPDEKKITPDVDDLTNIMANAEKRFLSLWPTHTLVPNFYIGLPDSDPLNGEYPQIVKEFYDRMNKAFSSVLKGFRKYGGSVSESLRKYGLGVNMKWHGLTDDPKHKPEDSNDKQKYR